LQFDLLPDTHAQGDHQLCQRRLRRHVEAGNHAIVEKADAGGIKAHLHRSLRALGNIDDGLVAVTDSGLESLKEGLVFGRVTGTVGSKDYDLDTAEAKNRLEVLGPEAGIKRNIKHVGIKHRIDLQGETSGGWGAYLTFEDTHVLADFPKG